MTQESQAYCEESDTKVVKLPQTSEKTPFQPSRDTVSGTEEKDHDHEEVEEEGIERFKV